MHSVAEMTPMMLPWNPTPDELRKWGFDPDAMAEQDWDLVISGDSDYDEIFLDLASQEACPKGGEFLSILYLIVGGAVRSNFNTRSQSTIEALIAHGDRRPH